MKKLALSFVIILACTALHGQKTRFGQELPNVRRDVDYPISVHVYGVLVRPFCQTHAVNVTPVSCMDVIYAEVTVNGKKFELRGDSDIHLNPFHPLKLSLGDYHARLTKGSAGSELDKIGNEYDLVLPDNKVLHCTVTGVFE
jgi:hypothetical protein